MSRHIVLSWVLLSLMGSTLNAQMPISRDQLPTRTALGRIGLERHWLAAVPMEPTEKLLEISMADNLVFAQTDHAGFHAYDAESGRLLWSTHLGHQLADAFPASVNSKMVFVTNANLLYALDRQTGRKVWVENLLVFPSSPTACTEEQVMVGLNTGLLRSFSLFEHDATGAVVKEDGQPKLASRPRFAWNWQTTGPVISTPLPAKRLVVFGGHDGRAYVAMADQTPKMLYRIATGGEITGPISSYGGNTFFVPSADKNVYAVDLFTADVKWTFTSGAPVRQEPLVAGSDVLVANTAGQLSAVEIATGNSRWSTSTHGGRLMAVSPKRLYLESYDEDLFIVDRGTGRIISDPRSTFSRAGVNLRAYDLSLTNRLNDRIYVAAKNGLIFSMREVGQTQPQPLRDPKSVEFGTIPAGVSPTPIPQPAAEMESTEEPAQEPK